LWFLSGTPFLVLRFVLWGFLILFWLFCGWSLRSFNGLFNLYLNIELDVLHNFFIDCEWPIGEEELNGDAIIDAEQIAG
jgi:hypothetical protein